MSADSPLRTEWKRPCWILTIDPVHKSICLEGGFSRSDSYTYYTLEEFLANIAFQQEIAGDFGLSILEEVLMTTQHVLARS